MTVNISVDVKALRELGTAMKAEQDGRQLKRDLTRNIRAALKPAQQDAKNSIRSMASHGHAGTQLRSTVARKVGINVRMSGRGAGARVRAQGTRNVRGFASAPRQLNLPGGWRHPVIGTHGRKWVRQIGKPEWFDNAMWKRRSEYRAAVRRAMEDTSIRLIRRG